MLRTCFLAGLLGLASAQSSSIMNNWYSAPANSGLSAATSIFSSRTSSITSPTSRAPSTPSPAVSSVVTPRTLSTLSTAASLSAISSSPASSSPARSSPASSSTARSSPASSSTARSSPTSSSTASSRAGMAIRAVATITPFGVGSTVRGTVIFEQADTNSPTNITYILSGNTPNALRGIHIHANSSTNCDAAGGHYNPFNMGHGLLDDPIRHAGDLGNIPIDNSGNAKGSLSARLVTMSGPNSVVGRTFVMHGGVDDGGKTGINSSSTTGNSGIRVACGIINLSA